MKTNAMRLLDARQIGYEVLSYEWDEQHIDAMSVAQAVGLDPMQVCKTIVTRGSDDAIRIICIPAPCEISLKKARALFGIGGIELVKQSQLRQLTGYIRGGVSPLGMIRPYPLFLEETMQLYDKVAISAGLRGFQLLLDPQDLLETAGGTWADLA